jgi:hypothetical protein
MNLENLEDFMLTGKKILNCINFENAQKINTNKYQKPNTNTNTKQILNNKQNSIKTQELTSLTTNNTIDNKIIDNKKTEGAFFFPKQKDVLFWCFYIIKYGKDAFNSLENINLVVEKKIKIECVDLLRKNKKMLKSAKMPPLANIENCLVNDYIIDLSSFFALCVASSINILYIYKKTYFLLSSCEIDNDNDNDDDNSLNTFLEKNNFHIVTRLENTINMGIYESDDFNEKREKIKECMNSFYKIDNIDKPIKAMSSYKLSELVVIANKLGLEIINKETNKQKTKKDIYQLIVQYF